MLICYGHGHFKVADLSHLKIGKNTFFMIKFDFINLAILHHPKQENIRIIILDPDFDIFVNFC